MEEEGGGDEGDALAVANVHIVEGVGPRELEERLLTRLLLEVVVGGQGAWQVPLNLRVEATRLQVNIKTPQEKKRHTNKTGRGEEA